MNILGRTQMLPEYSLLDSLDVIKRLGFDGVEICVERKNWSNHDVDALDMAAIRERVAALGLAPHSFSYHQNYIYDDEVFALAKKCIRLTPSFGTNIFIFGGTRKRTADEAEWRLMIDRTRELVAIAEECGVVMANEFEPNFVIGTTADLLRLFNDIPSGNLAANLDLGHVFLCDPDPLDAIRQLGRKIVHCHISNMPAGKHDHLPPQEGDMDLPAYLRALKSVGFDGGLALDLYKQDYEAVSPGAVAFLHKLIAEL